MLTRYKKSILFFFIKIKDGSDRVYKIYKRGADIFLSVLLLLVLSPLFLVIIAITIPDMGRSVFFRQRRMGRNGRPFFIYKFRTMLPQAPADVPSALLGDNRRYITQRGQFLRKTSLDELPQLWNILKGDMSFIGPRPVILNETELLQLRRKNGAETVRPGLTGLAQVCGRDELDDTEKAAYDGLYARRMGWRLDTHIFFATIRAVLRQEGVREG